MTHGKKGLYLKKITIAVACVTSIIRVLLLKRGQEKIRNVGEHNFFFLAVKASEKFSHFSQNNL